MSDIIPETYAQWRHCITEICGIPLTQAYIEQRLLDLNDQSDHMTRQYLRLYGNAQRQQTLRWFAQAQAELQ